MVKSVQLRKEDCYCDLTELYENVARKILVGITDKTCFDCTKNENEMYSDMANLKNSIAMVLEERRNGR